MAPGNEATHEVLRGLHPDGSSSGPMPPRPEPMPEPPAHDDEVFLKAFRKVARGKAHGGTGWRQEHYAMVAEHCVMANDVTSSNLFRVVNAIVAGRIPPPVCPYFAGGRLISLLKPSGGVRPIASR